VADTKGGAEEGAAAPYLTGCILKHAKILHEMHYFCIKISQIFCVGGIAPFPDPISYPSAPIPNYCIRHCDYVTDKV